MGACLISEALVAVLRVGVVALVVVVVGATTVQAASKWQSDPNWALPKRPATKRTAKPKCKQVIAPRVRARDLKLVGTIVDGAQRKLLLADKNGTGYFLMRGDCAGREKVPFDEWVTTPVDDGVRRPSRAARR